MVPRVERRLPREWTKPDSLCSMMACASSNMPFTTCAAGSISLMKADPVPPYIAMLSTSPSTVAFGGHPENLVISNVCTPKLSCARQSHNLEGHKVTVGVYQEWSEREELWMGETAHLSIDNRLGNHRLVGLVLLSSNFALPTFKEGRSEHTTATRPLSSPKNIWKLSAIRASFNHPLLVLGMSICLHRCQKPANQQNQPQSHVLIQQQISTKPKVTSKLNNKAAHHGDPCGLVGFEVSAFLEGVQNKGLVPGSHTHTLSTKSKRSHIATPIHNAPSSYHWHLVRLECIHYAWQQRPQPSLHQPCS
jgi:hypothetical protein